jgi:SAM-dependent methyltransferase
MPARPVLAGTDSDNRSVERGTLVIDWTCRPRTPRRLFVRDGDVCLGGVATLTWIGTSVCINALSLGRGTRGLPCGELHNVHAHSMRMDRALTNTTEQHYAGGDYWRERLTESSDFKVSLALRAMRNAGLTVEDGFTGTEVGCGNGAFLFPLRDALNDQLDDFRLTGLDIAPDAIDRADSRATKLGEERLSFRLVSDENPTDRSDVVFLMDVVEHVRNPYDLLESLHSKCSRVVLHLPLEQSLAHALLRRPTKSHERFRHIHFFSLETALLMIRECGYKVDTIQLTAASPEILRFKGTIVLKALRYMRYICYRVAPRQSAIAMGGSVMFVLSSAN